MGHGGNLLSSDVGLDLVKFCCSRLRRLFCDLEQHSVKHVGLKRGPSKRDRCSGSFAGILVKVGAISWCVRAQERATKAPSFDHFVQASLSFSLLSTVLQKVSETQL